MTLCVNHDATILCAKIVKYVFWCHMKIALDIPAFIQTISVDLYIVFREISRYLHMILGLSLSNYKFLVFIGQQCRL